MSDEYTHDRIICEQTNQIEDMSYENEKLRAALTRQCDNMAFLVNHASLYKWHDKFLSELSEDRKLL